MNRLICLALFAFFATSAGCGSVVVRKIDSRPSGAKLYVNGEFKGNTETTIEVDFRATPVVRILIVQPKFGPQEKNYVKSTFPQEDLVGDNAIQLSQVDN